jgi:hypothetical protein
MQTAMIPGARIPHSPDPTISADNFTNDDASGCLARPGGIGSRGDGVLGSYPGGKGGAGVYQTIINLMPPHRVYIEPFLGSARVMRAKLPADRNIGIDVDGETIAQVQKLLTSAELTSGDGVAFLERFKWQGAELVYCDPPYLMETRRSKRALYKFEVTHHQRRKLRGCKPGGLVKSGDWFVKAWAEMTKAARAATVRNGDAISDC